MAHSEHGPTVDEGIDSLRPKSSRLEAESAGRAQGLADSRVGAAAAAGRTDVLGTDSLLDLQRTAGNSGVTSMLEDDQPSPVHGVISSAGRPLDRKVRGDMEARLGHDFGDVRIHDDSAANASAAAVNAHAYTVGSNIVFQRDTYDPGSHAGRTTLAHELTHVVQQRSGPVDGTSAPGGVKISDPGDRFEREAAANADRVMAAATPVQTSAAGPSLQREADEDEEPVQGLFVQRAEDEEAEEPVQGLFVQRDESEEEETPA